MNCALLPFKGYDSPIVPCVTAYESDLILRMADGEEFIPHPMCFIAQSLGIAILMVLNKIKNNERKKNEERTNEKYKRILPSQKKKIPEHSESEYYMKNN